MQELVTLFNEGFIRQENVWDVIRDNSPIIGPDAKRLMDEAILLSDEKYNVLRAKLLLDDDSQYCSVITNEYQEIYSKPFTLSENRNYMQNPVKVTHSFRSKVTHQFRTKVTHPFRSKVTH